MSTVIEFAVAVVVRAFVTLRMAAVAPALRLAAPIVPAPLNVTELAVIAPTPSTPVSRPPPLATVTSPTAPEPPKTAPELVTLTLLLPEEGAVAVKLTYSFPPSTVVVPL